MANRVILVGRLGRDPETRYTQNGDAVCSFSLATSESWRDKTTGQRTEKTEWFNLVAYKKTAEISQQYLSKGSQVYIEGKFQSRKYTGKDGIERTSYEVIIEKLEMLGSRVDSQSSGDIPTPPMRKTEPKPPPVDDLDDDIPFN